MRGHLIKLGRFSGVERTIPAYAGAPFFARLAHHGAGDYPRVCGGTGAMQVTLTTAAGLSPRMRGHLGDVEALAASFGTIPAYAGAPGAEQPLQGKHGDYPRVCGGTVSGGMPVACCTGLSPRMRGHQLDAVDASQRRGTIPAYAGAPNGIIYLHLWR